MCWLYVPGSGASNLASDLPDLTRAASLTWRGKPMPPRLSLRAWKTGHSIRLLSGLTLPPSTLDRGAAAFIASLPVIPASQTPRSGDRAGPMTIDSSSIRSSGSWPSAGLVVSSARTSRGTQTASLRHSSQHWKGWATALWREYSARPTSVLAMAASAFSSWPTPLARDYKDGTAEVIRRGKVQKDTLGRALGGTPNPPWVEWLMGMPEGWTDCRSSATGWSRWWPLMRGALSSLGSTARPDQDRLL